LASPETKCSSGIAVIGEGPAREELAEGKCFAGPSGAELNKILMRAGIARSEVAIENAFACWKPDNAKPHEEARAVEACRGRLWEWIERVRPRGLILLGGRALRSVLPSCVSGASSDGLMRWRGTLLSRQEVESANATLPFPKKSLSMSVEWVMPTIHPAAIIRRARLEKFPAMGYRGVTSIDARRLRDALVAGRTLLPIARTVGLPSVNELNDGFIFDLETVGREDRTPVLVGLQLMRGGVVYQLPFDSAKDWLREAMRRDCLKIGHNIHGFDIHVLEDNSIGVKEPFWDTMVAAGMCEPDMARGLYFQGAYYFGHRRPYWKKLTGADLKKRDEVRVQRAVRAIWEATGSLGPHLTELDWELDYNAADCDSTRLVQMEQEERGRREGWL
jgi:uracil-DNA glycosylase family 4